MQSKSVFLLSGGCLTSRSAAVKAEEVLLSILTLPGTARRRPKLMPSSSYSGTGATEQWIGSRVAEVVLNSVLDYYSFKL